MFPFKPSAHISVDAFEETLPPSQAREFGHRQALLMFFCWSIMPQSQSLRKSYKVGLRHSYWPQVQAKNGTKFFCSTTFSYQAARQHLDSSGIAYPCAVRARYAVLDRAAIGDGLFRDVLHEDRARIALGASNAITSVVASESFIAVHVLDRGLLTLRQTREAKVDHGGSGSDIVSLEAPRNFG